MEISNFEAILDKSSDEDHALSDDSDYNSDQSEDLTEIVEKTVFHSEIIALNRRTKFCAIYFYYSTGGDYAVCASCMIAIADADYGYMYAVRKHVTELYDVISGRSCSNCRQALYQMFMDRTTIFHNLSGYDSHFIIKEIATAFEDSVNVLPITKEKYISFTKHVKDTVEKSDWRRDIKLRFIDSYKFLSTCLEKLASFPNNDKLQTLKPKFQNLSIKEVNLLRRKGVFPYKYIDDTCLPSRESFYNFLTGDTVSESDYAHAENVWRRFSLRTLGEYSDLYLKTDVLLLADIFENFRNKCIESYGLDPLYYYTLPGYTWDAMLTHTNLTFELLIDIDMVMFIEREIHGGLSQCSGRYARANNKYTPFYDLSKPSSYMMYFDVDDISDFDVNAIASDSPTGYIFEVDLEYPQHLHDAHADLPFCPTRDKPPGERQDKLLATLYDKKRYVIHYRNLQQCTRHGLRIAKIHRVLQLAQSAWLRDYIEINTRFRTRAINDFEKNLYKLMNNAVFDKPIKNVRNHVDVKLLTKWGGRYDAEAMIAKSNFHSRSVFLENLIAVELRKFEVKFNKPIYIGMCILDISKTYLYEFHHEYMVPLHREKCKIMYTNTDSLIYHIECEDVYKNMKRDIARFDTSDYPVNDAYGIPLENKKVPDLMKDKNNSAIMTEFVGLRSKMYALRVDSKMNTKKVKGVKNNVVARTITFDNYTYQAKWLGIASRAECHVGPCLGNGSRSNPTKPSTTLVPGRDRSRYNPAELRATSVLEVERAGAIQQS
ncbi:uncharacterized protein [Polyergus mexicanus]|uniref:uncharacterized protein n=1 Tax=Polyergus mexicanus TaxID=615972 RepID=UPI0038B685C8